MTVKQLRDQLEPLADKTKVLLYLEEHEDSGVLLEVDTSSKHDDLYVKADPLDIKEPYVYLVGHP